MSSLSQEMLQSLLDNAPNMIIVVSRDGTIQYINRTVNGFDGGDVVGTNQFDYINEEYKEVVRETIEQVFSTGKPGQYVIEGTGADGGISWYSTFVGPIKNNGEVVAVSLFVTDISDRKKAEEDLKKTQERLLSQQSQAILELSTPVIQIWDEILVLPLIGTVDTARAQQIIENLLDSIVTSQASVAIIDITGVPVVDTKVADHFIKTIEAAKMLGTEVILTGVSPYNALTLVKMGVDLGRITTKGTLQTGLKLAFEITKHRVEKEA